MSEILSWAKTFKYMSKGTITILPPEANSRSVSFLPQGLEK